MAGQELHGVPGLEQEAQLFAVQLVQVEFPPIENVPAKHGEQAPVKNPKFAGHDVQVFPVFEHTAQAAAVQF